MTCSSFSPKLAIELFKGASYQASNVLKKIFPQNEINFSTRKKRFSKARLKAVRCLSCMEKIRLRFLVQKYGSFFPIH